MRFIKFLVLLGMPILVPMAILVAPFAFVVWSLWEEAKD